MSAVLIRVSSALYNGSEVLVNGQREDFKKNGRGSYELQVPSDVNTEIQIKRKHELLSPLWLVWGLFFFVISCFGIFDVRYSKTPALTCKVNILPGSGGTVYFAPRTIKDGKGVLIDSGDCVVDELENTSDYAIIKKRLKALRIIKALLWVALIVAIVLIVVL